MRGLTICKGTPGCLNNAELSIDLNGKTYLVCKPCAVRIKKQVAAVKAAVL